MVRAGFDEQDGIQAYNDLSFQRKWAQGKSATLRFARSAHSENGLLPCKSAALLPYPGQAPERGL